MNLQDMFRQREGYAIAAFNVYGYEDAAAVLRSAQACSLPVILMVNRDAAAHMPLWVLGPLLGRMARAASVPVAVHLDHAVSLEPIREAVDCGFTSLMFDGSQLPFEENVEKTRQAMAIARERGVSVEAEIGSVAYSDPAIPIRSIYTEPREAKAFYEATGVDCLAVAVGTVHRMTTQSASIQYDRLQQIQDLITVPLVIHGSTSVTDADLQELSRRGVRKINIGTCLRMAFGNGLRKAVSDNPGEFDRVKLFQLPMALVEQAAGEKMRLLHTA
jgi:fructose-bisphosphate aldolase class II